MENENRHEKFTRLAEARTSNVLEIIDLIGNLSNKSSYAYTKQEVELILKLFARLVITMRQNSKSSVATGTRSSH